MRPVLRNAVVLAVALWAAGCADIRFEQGPYTIRALEVVYSEQEDMTFISWNLRHDAKLSLVSFELHTEDGWTPIRLSDAPFAADPYECTGGWCLQYQVHGEYVQSPDTVSPLRSIHRDDGVFMGPEPRVRRIRTSFQVDPIALGKNESIDPRRYDWFAENAVPLRRAWQWQFATWNDALWCDDPDTSWKHADDPVAVDRSWTELATDGGICFYMRPVRADDASVWDFDTLTPSAETAFDTQRYVPARTNAPIVWGMLVDLEIPDDTRCRQVKGVLIDAVEAAMASRGNDHKLGIYAPQLADGGDELSGCDQDPNREYPLSQMLRDAEDARREILPDETRVVWIFANNIELPPSQRIVDQMELLGLALLLGDDFDLDVLGNPDIVGELGDNIGVLGPLDDVTTAWTWAIGSNVFMEMFPWHQTTPWRPVEDETLVADIRAAADNALPFATMQHDATTQVDITPVDTQIRPSHFKVCSSSPFAISAVGVNASFAAWSSDATIPWPTFDDELPYYLVEIPPQILVPKNQYRRYSQNVVMEVCTAFCDGPFRTRGGLDLLSWRNDPICQWNQ